MIRRKEEIRTRRVENAKGGTGFVTFHDWLLPEEAHGHGPTFAKVVIEPGNSIGYHQHVGNFEAVYILSGVATVTENGMTTELYPGDVNVCPEGGFHGIANQGTETLEMMALILDDLRK